jgi:ribose-phosphate pyrophosphokinase
MRCLDVERVEAVFYDGCCQIGEVYLGGSSQLHFSWSQPMNDAGFHPIVFAMNGATRIAEGVEKWIQRNWSLSGAAEDRLRGSGSGSSFRLADKEERRRSDRESYALSRGNVRGRKIYIIQSFATDQNEVVDEKIWGTLLFINSLQDASAGDVILVGTLFPYMRQDSKDQPRAPIDTAYFVRQFWAAGVTRFIGMDVHNQAAMQNACAALKVKFDHLEARCPLASAVANDLPEEAGHDRRVVVCTPDMGATKRTKQFQDTLARSLQRRFKHPVRVGFAHGDKVRTGDSTAEVTTIIEDPTFPIKDSLVIVPDDILATGGTLKGIESAIQRRGGEMFAACVTHGIFTGDAEENLASIARIYTTRTVCPWRIKKSPLFQRVHSVDVDDIFARAIRETHLDGSINHLLTSLEEGV